MRILSYRILDNTVPLVSSNGQIFHLLILQAGLMENQTIGVKAKIAFHSHTGKAWKWESIGMMMDVINQMHLRVRRMRKSITRLRIHGQLTVDVVMDGPNLPGDVIEYLVAGKPRETMRLN